MNKYYFEADKKQLEKPTEPLYMFCAPARVWTVADSEEQARALALEKLNAKHHASGTVLGRELRLTNAVELPEDWSYGYGGERHVGTAEEKAALWRACTK